MRRLAIILVVLLSLGLGSTAQAVDLEAGWYAKVGSVALYGWSDDHTYYHGVDWDFVGGLGEYWPFSVTSEGLLWQRMVSVQNTSNSVPAGTAIYLYGQPQSEITFPVDRIDLAFETSYDASKMRLEAYVHRLNGADELIWSQANSGYAYGGPSIVGANLAWPGETLYLKVTAVPGPSGIFSLSMGLCVMVAAISRRYRR